MSVTQELEPQNVFKYFEEICNIPHGSGNVKRISDYLVEFAKEHGLDFIQDDYCNVIIFKSASGGYENEPTVIIQGHMDMVAVSDADCTKNMETDGLDLVVDGNYLFANKTSLGGDDGIALAMALAILDDESLSHPAIEAVFTVDEEVGMLGAEKLDASSLKGKRLLNIDNEEENYVLTGCAGGARATITLELSRDLVLDKEKQDIVCISVSGGLGGHSGTEIDKGRANAILIAGMLLEGICKNENEVNFVSLTGGAADNAIPGDATLVIYVSKECDICQCMQPVVDEVKAKYHKLDSCLQITSEVIIAHEANEEKAVNFVQTQNLASLLTSIPNGIQAMSKDVEGLVETSLNLGIAATDNNELILHYALRSSVDKDKETLMQKVEAIANEHNATCSFSGVYPGWKYRKDSPLREKIISIYKEMFGKTPEVAAIHAGLECGFFAEKIEDLDCVSIGPNILDIHTTAERLDIASTKRCYELILRVLSERG